MTEAPPTTTDADPIDAGAQHGLIVSAARIMGVAAVLRPDEWDDYFQEMTLAVLRSLRSYRPERGAWSTYCMCGLVRNAWKAYYRIRLRPVHNPATGRLQPVATASTVWPSGQIDETISPYHHPDFDEIDAADESAVQYPRIFASGLLSARDREILTLRYGLADHEPHSLEQVGEKLGVTRERVRQIQNLALTKLARRFKGE